MKFRNRICNYSQKIDYATGAIQTFNDYLSIVKYLAYIFFQKKVILILYFMRLWFMWA